MGQKDITKAIRLLLFNDEKLMDLMMVPADKRDDLVSFRDEYCVVGLDNAPNVIADNVPVRLVLGWASASDTNNPSVLLRKLRFEIYVSLTYQYEESDNVLDRRTELITNRIIYLLSEKRIEGFKLKVADLGDLDTFSYDYTRSFVTFTVKNVY